MTPATFFRRLPRLAVDPHVAGRRAQSSYLALCRERGEAPNVSDLDLLYWRAYRYATDLRRERRAMALRAARSTAIRLGASFEELTATLANASAAMRRLSVAWGSE